MSLKQPICLGRGRGRKPQQPVASVSNGKLEPSVTPKSSVRGRGKLPTCVSSNAIPPVRSVNGSTNSHQPHGTEETGTSSPAVRNGSITELSSGRILVTPTAVEQAQSTGQDTPSAETDSASQESGISRSSSCGSILPSSDQSALVSILSNDSSSPGSVNDRWSSASSSSLDSGTSTSPIVHERKKCMTAGQNSSSRLGIHSPDGKAGDDATLVTSSRGNEGRDSNECGTNYGADTLEAILVCQNLPQIGDTQAIRSYLLQELQEYRYYIRSMFVKPGHAFLNFNSLPAATAASEFLGRRGVKIQDQRLCFNVYCDDKRLRKVAFNEARSPQSIVTPPSKLSRFDSDPVGKTLASPELENPRHTACLKTTATQPEQSQPARGPKVVNPKHARMWFSNASCIPGMPCPGPAKEFLKDALSHLADGVVSVQINGPTGFVEFSSEAYARNAVVALTNNPLKLIRGKHLSVKPIQGRVDLTNGRESSGRERSRTRETLSNLDNSGKTLQLSNEANEMARDVHNVKSTLVSEQNNKPVLAVKGHIPRVGQNSLSLKASTPGTPGGSERNPMPSVISPVDSSARTSSQCPPSTRKLNYETPKGTKGKTSKRANFNYVLLDGVPSNMQYCTLMPLLRPVIGDLHSLSDAHFHEGTAFLRFSSLDAASSACAALNAKPVELQGKVLKACMGSSGGESKVTSDLSLSDASARNLSFGVVGHVSTSLLDEAVVASPNQTCSTTPVTPTSASGVSSTPSSRRSSSRPRQPAPFRVECPMSSQCFAFVKRRWSDLLEKCSKEDFIVVRWTKEMSCASITGTPQSAILMLEKEIFNAIAERSILFSEASWFRWNRLVARPRYSEETFLQLFMDNSVAQSSGKFANSEAATDWFADKDNTSAVVFGLRAEVEARARNLALIKNHCYPLNCDEMAVLKSVPIEGFNLDVFEQLPCEMCPTECQLLRVVPSLRDDSHQYLDKLDDLLEGYSCMDIEIPSALVDAAQAYIRHATATSGNSHRAALALRVPNEHESSSHNLKQSVSCAVQLCGLNTGLVMSVMEELQYGVQCRKVSDPDITILPIQGEMSLQSISSEHSIAFSVNDNPISFELQGYLATSLDDAVSSLKAYMQLTSEQCSEEVCLDPLLHRYLIRTLHERPQDAVLEVIGDFSEQFQVDIQYDSSRHAVILSGLKNKVQQLQRQIKESVVLFGRAKRDEILIFGSPLLAQFVEVAVVKPSLAQLSVAAVVDRLPDAGTLWEAVSGGVYELHMEPQPGSSADDNILRIQLFGRSAQLSSAIEVIKQSILNSCYCVIAECTSSLPVDQIAAGVSVTFLPARVDDLPSVVAFSGKDKACVETAAEVYENSRATSPSSGKSDKVTCTPEPGLMDVASAVSKRVDIKATAACQLEPAVSPDMKVRQYEFALMWLQEVFILRHKRAWLRDMTSRLLVTVSFPEKSSSTSASGMCSWVFNEVPGAPESSGLSRVQLAYQEMCGITNSLHVSSAEATFPLDLVDMVKVHILNAQKDQEAGKSVVCHVSPVQHVTGHSFPVGAVCLTTCSDTLTTAKEALVALNRAVQLLPMLIRKLPRFLWKPLTDVKASFFQKYGVMLVILRGKQERSDIDVLLAADNLQRLQAGDAALASAVKKLDGLRQEQHSTQPAQLTPTSPEGAVTLPSLVSPVMTMGIVGENQSSQSHNSPISEGKQWSAAVLPSASTSSPDPRATSPPVVNQSSAVQCADPFPACHDTRSHNDDGFENSAGLETQAKNPGIRNEHLHNPPTSLPAPDTTEGLPPDRRNTCLSSAGDEAVGHELSPQNASATEKPQAWSSPRPPASVTSATRQRTVKLVSMKQARADSAASGAASYADKLKARK